MTERCRHDLAPATCATCRGLDEPAPTGGGGMSRPFPARHPGVCAGCGGDIVPDEQVVYAEGFVIHDEGGCR